MFKTLSISFILCCSAFCLLAQTNLELNILHKFNKSTYVAGQLYIDDNDRALSISNIQYYLSNIELLHDGLQSTVLNNQHFLIDGETETYDLGTSSTTIQELEKIQMNLGLDATTNAQQPSDYPLGHVLASPLMYSTSQQSYIFLTIEGMVDTNNDQIPDKPFSFKATGNQLLRNISLETQASSDDNSLKIILVANIANWLKEIDLEAVGHQENGLADNQQLCDNTNEHNVFYNVATTSIHSLVSPRNHIYIDARLALAPTIHYKFYTLEQVDMTITNINGSYFIQRFDLQPEGDFYMSENLASGIYIVIFTSPKGIRQSKRFVIRN